METKFRLPKKARCFLYILLLTCIFCATTYSQNGFFVTNCKGDTTAYIENVGGRLFQRIMPHNTTIDNDESPNILSDLIEYSNECYNDSIVWIKYYDWVDITKITVLDSTMIDYSRTIVDRKEPTFQDFARWLRKKYGL